MTTEVATCSICAATFSDDAQGRRWHQLLQGHAPKRIARSGGSR